MVGLNLDIFLLYLGAGFILFGPGSIMTGAMVSMMRTALKLSILHQVQPDLYGAASERKAITPQCGFTNGAYVFDPFFD